jgi:hypothetical protein
MNNEERTVNNEELRLFIVHCAFFIVQFFRHFFAFGLLRKSPLLATPFPETISASADASCVGHGYKAFHG